MTRRDDAVTPPLSTSTSPSSTGCETAAKPPGDEFAPEVVTEEWAEQRNDRRMAPDGPRRPGKLFDPAAAVRSAPVRAVRADTAHLGSAWPHGLALFGAGAAEGARRLIGADPGEPEHHRVPDGCREHD